MKKKTVFLQLALAASLIVSTITNAATPTKDIPVGSSGQMEMVGTIEANVLSVTMPSYVPFNISNGIEAQNKVISPRIVVQNNSNIPVRIDVAYTRVDLSNLHNVSWNDTGSVEPNQIAIGLKKEGAANKMPQDLVDAKWLPANKKSNINVMDLEAKKSGAMYVVGSIGYQVTDNATFSVTPTFVVGWK